MFLKTKRHYETVAQFHVTYPIKIRGIWYNNRFELYNILYELEEKYFNYGITIFSFYSNNPNNLLVILEDLQVNIEYLNNFSFSPVEFSEDIFNQIEGLLALDCKSISFLGEFSDEQI